MNIWMLNHYASNMYFDKAGRHYFFAKKLEQLGLVATVFCASTLLNKDQTVDTGAKIWCEEKADGTSFVFIKCPKYKSNGFDRIRNMITFYRRLKPVARQYIRKTNKPDVIIASSVHPLTLVAGIQIAKKLKIPCICEIRDLWPESIFAFGKVAETSFLGKILLKGEHWIYKKADALIFTKEGDTDYLKEKKWTTDQGGDIDLKKCYYINNGVDFQTYQKQIYNNIFADEDLNNDSYFKIVYAGTIRPVNNVEILVDCAKLIQSYKGLENVRVFIFGEGIELPKLCKKAQEEGIKNIIFKGFVERKYIPYILSRASVNILNYSQEHYNWKRGNSSNKLFEYMASGKPVISTVKTGYSIINKYQCGIELDECTPECLAKAILRFREMPKCEYEEYSKHAYEGAKDFDFNILTEKLMSVIRSVKDL